VGDEREPRIRLGGAVLISIVAIAGVAGAGIAALITARVTEPGTPDPVVSSLLGSLAALLVSVPLLVAIQPWKVRIASTWATIWLATIVGRLLITPLVGLAVYSATPVRLDAFLLSLAGAYVACLAAEVAVSARSVARSLGAAEAEARRRSAASSPDPSSQSSNSGSTSASTSSSSSRSPP